jgi:ABC-type molybdate transport system substrate-binding protein
VTKLTDVLLSPASARHVRPKSADLIALLEVGELDAAFIYESAARGARLPFVMLGNDVDLGTDALADVYRSATVTIVGERRGDSVIVHATPIRYGISVPGAAAKHTQALAFVRWLLGSTGQRILRAEYLDALPDPTVVGANAPPLQ